MRIERVRVHGIGGLKDGIVELPCGPVTALAGTNGTGKSKLLACILSPWTGAIPSARSGEAAQVSVALRVNSTERQSLEEFSRTAGWGDVEVPEVFDVTTRQDPLAGVQYFSQPQQTVLAHFARHSPLLQSRPSLDVIFLPAERRFMPASYAGVDLNQLSEELAFQATANARGAVQNYGRLDDSEFEQFAKALSVAAQLGDDPDDEVDASPLRIGWDEFVETVNSLIAPKRLLPLTKRHPETLRIATADGHHHGVQELSSGERQALIIISRILRAGAGHSAVLIDEPDAYLHPHLSRRLALALEQAVGPDGQLILATHSPAVLDTISPSSILRLSHSTAPRPVTDEAERLEVYREAGFRASALTQSDLLLITEGDADCTLLPLLLPVLERATLRAAGGRASVIDDVTRLAPYDLPVLGVVDGDVLPPSIPQSVHDKITVWDAGDIEGVFLSDDIALEVMIDRGLVKHPYVSVLRLRELLDELLLSQEENFAAEAAQRLLREKANMKWPTPKGDSPIERLRRAVKESVRPTAGEVEECLEHARDVWSKKAADGDLWAIVRGKYILQVFTQQAGTMRSGQALLEAVARARPPLTRLHPLGAAVEGSLLQ